MNVRAASVAALICSVMCLASVSGQTDITWIGGDGEWTEASNWSPATVPSDATHRVLFDSTAGTVTWTSDGSPVTLHSINFASDAVATLSLVGSAAHDLTLSGAAFELGNSTLLCDGVWPGFCSISAPSISGSGTGATFGCTPPGQLTVDGSVDVTNIAGSCTVIFNDALTTEEYTVTTGNYDQTFAAGASIQDISAIGLTNNFYFGGPVDIHGSAVFGRPIFRFTDSTANLTTHGSVVLGEEIVSGTTSIWAEGNNPAAWNVMGTLDVQLKNVQIRSGTKVVIHSGATVNIIDTGDNKAISAFDTGSEVLLYGSLISNLGDDDFLELYYVTVDSGSSLSSDGTIQFAGASILEDGAQVEVKVLTCITSAVVDVYADLDSVDTIIAGVICEFHLHKPLENTTALGWSYPISEIHLHEDSVVPFFSESSGGHLYLYKQLTLLGDATYSGGNMHTFFAEEGSAFQLHGRMVFATFLDGTWEGPGVFNITPGAVLESHARYLTLEDGAAIDLHGTLQVRRDDSSSSSTFSRLSSANADIALGSKLTIFESGLLTADTAAITANFRLDTLTDVYGSLDIAGGNLEVGLAYVNLLPNSTVTFNPESVLHTLSNGRVVLDIPYVPFNSLLVDGSSIVFFKYPLEDIPEVVIKASAQLYLQAPSPAVNNITALAFEGGSVFVDSHLGISSSLTVGASGSGVANFYLQNGSNSSLTLLSGATLSGECDICDLWVRGIQDNANPVELDEDLLASVHIFGDVTHNFNRFYLNGGVVLTIHEGSLFEMTRITGSTSFGRSLAAWAPNDGSSVHNYGTILCNESSGGIYNDKEGCHVDAFLYNYANVTQGEGTLSFEQGVNQTSDGLIFSRVDTGIFFQSYFGDVYLEGTLDITNMTVIGPKLFVMTGLPDGINLSVRESQSRLALTQDISINELQVWTGIVVLEDGVTATVTNVTTVGTTVSDFAMGSNASFHLMAPLYSYSSGADMRLVGPGSMYVHDEFVHNFGNIRFDSGAQLVFLDGSSYHVPDSFPANAPPPSMSSDVPDFTAVYFHPGSVAYMNQTDQIVAVGYRLQTSCLWNSTLVLGPGALLELERHHVFGSNAKVLFGSGSVLNFDIANGGASVDEDAKLMFEGGQFVVSSGSMALSTSSIENGQLGSFSAVGFASLDFLGNCPAELEPVF